MELIGAIIRGGKQKREPHIIVQWPKGQSSDYFIGAPFDQCR
jgi:hypothetical protein